VLSHDRDLMPRTWMGNEDIRSITREARLGVFRHDIFQLISITILLGCLSLFIMLIHEKHNLVLMLHCRL
jgi:hypothetical protein